MHKKIWILIVCVICIVLLSSVYSKNQYKKIDDIVDINYKDVTRISFRDGRTGEIIETKDKEKIKEFLSQIDSYRLKKSILQQDIEGYIYYVDFYKNYKEVLRITFGSPLKVNGFYYDIVKGEIDLKSVDNFVKSIKK